MFELGGVHEDGRDGQSVLVVAAGRGAVERRNGDERRLASPTSIPPLAAFCRGRPLPLKIPLTASRIPVESAGRSNSLRGIPDRASKPPPRQPLAVSVQDWKEDDLTDEVGPLWACAAQPASNLQNQ